MVVIDLNGMSLKLITLNIEGDCHTHTVSDFLKAQQADIVCLQEIFEVDVAYFKNLLGANYVLFAPLMQVTLEVNIARLAPKGNWGIAIFSKKEPILLEKKYYAGTNETVPVFDNQPNTNNRAMIVAKVEKDNSFFTVITTHFTWASAEDAAVSELQLAHLKEMKKILNTYSDYILCGDFNAPKGREIYAQISEGLIDHLPENTVSTIDPNLHKVKGLSLIVDSIFSTPEYKTMQINIKDGVSDHKAIIAIMDKVN